VSRGRTARERSRGVEEVPDRAWLKDASRNLPRLLEPVLTGPELRRQRRRWPADHMGHRDADGAGTNGAADGATADDGDDDAQRA
jgi:hypothetical protein